MDNNKIDDEIKKASKQESFLVRLQEKLAKFKGARTSETKLFGKKAAVVKEKQMEKVKEFAKNFKDSIISSAKEIAKIKELAGEKKFSLASLISAIAIAGVVGFSMNIGLNQKNQKENIKDANIGVEDSLRDDTERATIETKAEEVIHHAVDMRNIYKGMKVNNSAGFINFRDYPSTGNESNIIRKVLEDETLYVQSSDENVENSDNNGHNWQRAIYYSENGEPMEGFVDANLLAYPENEEEQIIIKNDDIVSYNDEESSEYNQEDLLELKAKKVNAPVLNIRYEPSTQYGSVVSKQEEGNTIYTYDNSDVVPEDEAHDWRHAIFYDGEVYRNGYVDNQYLITKVGCAGTQIRANAPYVENIEPETESTEPETQIIETVQNNEQQLESAQDVTEEVESSENTELVANEADNYVADDLEAFKEYPGYYEYLSKLKKQHPNWSFKMYKTGEDFQNCVDKSNNANAVSVPAGWGKEWYSYDENGALIFIDSGPWYKASRECTAAMMDPRNFLNEAQIFQFEVPKRTAENVSLEDVKKVFSDVKWANADKFSYMDTNKNIVTLDKSFAELLYDVCIEYNFNPLQAASSIKIEQGNGDVPGAMTGRGTIPGYEGLYNYGNIGAYAYAYSDIESAGECGLIRARSEGWDSPEAAIRGYIEHEISKFVEGGRDCKYLKKFDLANGWEIYMSNFLGAYNEADVVYSGANLDAPYEFKIPVFENMPENLCELPAEPNWALNVNGGVKKQNIVAEVSQDDYER
ncbi:MAG: hypothetical protein IJH12_09455 [Clostridia bacterium]|nr:hypothetical protein [Clostridia bacterium]